LYRQENSALFVGHFSLKLAFNLQILPANRKQALVAGESSETLDPALDLDLSIIVQK
jgi:hypothetical protein